MLGYTETHHQPHRLCRYRCGRSGVCSAIANVVKELTHSELLQYTVEPLYFIWCLNRLPFDWRNLTGYLEAVLLQTFVFTYGYFFCGCGMALAIGFFMIIRSAVKDMSYILHSINKCANDTRRDHSSRMLEKLSAFVQLHSNIKQLRE